MTNKIPSIILWVLLGLAALVIIACMVMTPGQITVSDGTEMSDSNMGLFLGYNYFLLGATVVVTLLAACMSFITSLQKDKKKAFIMIGGVAALLLLLLITYLTGDGTPMHLVGYEGDENTSGWLKMCDMFLRTSYILIFIGIICIIASPFAKKIK